MLGNISVGWITTPVISAVMCFVALFFLQNVFNQQVYRQVHYELSPPVLEKLAQLDIATEKLDDLQGKEFDSSVKFLEALEQKASLTTEQEQKTLYYAEVEDFVIEPEKIDTLDADWLTPSQITALRELSGRTFRYKWRLAGALARRSDDWKLKPHSKLNKLYNSEIKKELDYIYRTFASNG
jgi:PiT family inorganic phosphate transporter